MQKILYILEDGRFGGMPKMIADIAHGVGNQKVVTRLIVGEKHSDYLLSKIKAYNIPCDKVPVHILSKNKKAVFQFLLYFIPDVIKLIRIIKRHDPDIVYCNGSQHVKGVIAARLAGKTVVWHMHDTYQPQLILTLFNLIRSVFRVKYFAASCERTIAFYKLPKENTLLSRPPVDTQKFTPPITEKISGSEKSISIVSVSNVNPDKGLDILIQTAAIVNQSRQDVRFKVVGLIPDTQVTLYEQLLSLARTLDVRNLEFAGQRDDIYDILSETDLYLCASNNESGPIAVFEAMSMEVPVVATDVGDLRKIFDFNHSGRIQPVKDPAALAKEILDLLTHPLEMVNFAQKGRITAQEYLDIRHSVTNHINFYKKALNR